MSQQPLYSQGNSNSDLVSSKRDLPSSELQIAPTKPSQRKSLLYSTSYPPPPYYIHLALKNPSRGSDHAISASRPGSGLAEIDQATLVADEDPVSAGSTEDLAVRLAVAGVVGADPVLSLVTEGSGGDGTEGNLLGAVVGVCADGECCSAVAEECARSADAGGSWVGWFRWSWSG